MYIKTKMGQLEARHPREDDTLKLIDFVRALVEEDAPILTNRVPTYEEEVKWLRDNLHKIAQGSGALFVVEDNGRIISVGDLRRGEYRQSHHAQLGISVAKEYRGLGIGKEVIKLLLAEGKRMGLKFVWLDVFATNKKAAALYRKMGFRKVATLPKYGEHKGRFVDYWMMVKWLR